MLIALTLLNEPPKTSNASELNKQELPQATTQESEVVEVAQSEVKAKTKKATTQPKKVQPKKQVTSTCESELKKYNWNQRIAYEVMMVESSGNHLALNNNPNTGDYSVGCFQVNLYGSLRNTRPSESWLKVPANNVAYAYQLYKANGWSPWGFTTCKYKVKCY